MDIGLVILQTVKILYAIHNQKRELTTIIISRASDYNKPPKSHGKDVVNFLDMIMARKISFEAKSCFDIFNIFHINTIQSHHFFGEGG